MLETQVTTVGSSGIAWYDQGCIIGFPPEGTYMGRGRVQINVMPVTINRERLMEVLDAAHEKGVPVLFYGRVEVSPN